MPFETSEATRRMEKAKRYLRLFLRDTPELNRLTRKFENDDIALEFGIEMCISDWNATTPLIGSISIETFPSIFLLMHGAAVQLLGTEGLKQARNELNYNAGGSSFIRSNKTQAYMQWMINFDNKYQLMKRNLKIHQNVELGWGGVVSEYDRLGYAW
jgi:hypothetical protein